MVLHNVYVANQRIKTIVTSSGDAVSTWVDSILDFHRNRLNSLLVGVDVKWCPHGKFGTTGENPIATLQLCIGHSCLIFHIINCNNIPENFRQFLVNNQIRFVGLGIRGAAARLENDYPLSFGPKIEDIREFAARKMCNPEVRNYGLHTLALVVKELQTEDPTSVKLSNWGTRRLTEEQIEYAAVDAFLTFTIALELELNY